VAKRPSSSAGGRRTSSALPPAADPYTPPAPGQSRPQSDVSGSRDSIGRDQQVTASSLTRIKFDGKMSMVAYPTVVPTVDVVLIGDSWAAFGWNRGTTTSTISLSGGAFLDLAGAFNITLANCPSGMISVSDTNAPVIVAGKTQQGREGFTSTSGKGQLADAFINAGIDIDQLNIWEYSCGATTAGQYDYTGTNPQTSSGAWDYDLPTTQSSLGGTYGTTGASLLGAGWKINGSNTSAWLQTQEWLDGTGHPFENYTLCDMIAHPPTGRCIVMMCLGGNDAIDTGHRQRYLDPFDGTFDPTGAHAAQWDHVAAVSGDSSIRRITNAIYTLNDQAEVFWVSYLNMPVDDPDLRNARLVLPPVDPAATTDGPVGWHAYAGDGTNPVPAVLMDTPYDNPSTMDSVTWPTGPGFPSFPVTWNINTPGFHRIYHAWNTLFAQKNYSGMHDWFRTYVAFWYATDNAWQGQGTEASHPAPVFNNHNYQWTHDVVFDGAGINYTGHRWNAIYSRIRSVYSDTGTTQNFISAVQTHPINWHQYQTIINKDLTTASMSRLFRGMQQPRMAAMQTYWQNLGKKFWALDLYDQVPAYYGGTSQDDPDGVRCLPKDNFIDLHLSSIGNPKWCALIAQHLLRRTTLLTPT
jgi:hypothetical protein